MKNFDFKKFLFFAGAVVVGMTVYNLGNAQLNKMKTKAPASV